MRLLLLTLNHHPEPTGIGKYNGEMVAWLSARGHEVTVVCAPPYYPFWRVQPGYRAWAYRREMLDGATVMRCPLWVPRTPGGFRRLLHLLSFAVSTFPVMVARAVAFRPDVVMAIEPPLAGAPAALAAAFLSRAVGWLHVQDLEVDAAFDLGLLGHGWLRRSALAVERTLLRRFAVVSTIAPRMAERLAAKGVPGERLHLFPNWVDTAAIRPLDGPSPLRREVGLGDDDVVALYAGNLGRKQGLEMLIEVARLLADRPRLVICIAGEGPALPALREAARGLANLRFLPLQPVERLNDLLNLADIHLLPQRADAADLVMPSKLSGMLASGRPGICGCAPGTQLYDAIAGCGIAVPPGDAGRMADALAALADDAGLRRTLGAAARRAAAEHWSKDAVLGRFEKLLRRSARSGPVQSL
ncbi:WcaI family glycosyltransferase [Rhodocista pekingensis]|uniref:WcaI family glycosyltransferase n=1 Tax=Rhodocista pekingensis TaxID=201185 RepID=A0ABW2KY01_9PROT